MFRNITFMTSEYLDVKGLEAILTDVEEQDGEK